MKLFRKKDKRSRIIREIDRLQSKLEELDPTEEDYAIISDRMIELVEVNCTIQKARVSGDTKAIIAGNLLGILLILSYERVGVVTSKALGFVLKGRV